MSLPVEARDEQFPIVQLQDRQERELGWRTAFYRDVEWNRSNVRVLTRYSLDWTRRPILNVPLGNYFKFYFYLLEKNIRTTSVIHIFWTF